MKIKYQGKSQKRVVGRYVWERSNGYVTDVWEPDVITELLTAPTNEFVALEEPAMVEQVMEAFIAFPVEEPVKVEQVMEEFIAVPVEEPVKKTWKPRASRKSKSATGG